MKESMIFSGEKEISLDNTVNHAINFFTARIQGRFGEKIKKVILFGSYARGEATPDSNVELMVITSDNSFDTKYEIIGMGFDLFLETGGLLSVKVTTETLFRERNGFLFFRELSRDGVIVA
ncbi:nucleotidyltransferase domain-containing protein [Methanospirillum stamsii]|uniref:Polymerase beta nucleotidyltransferase domain-containing protein n=1 Tax=Methanospirillum stamsii TaxID=1277351 RepID=A0A2V2MVJ8_9EURY|nr:nucleotidyltransferase domain-containing protein [Methanospirillum stamsii]PWR70320.1 hypothetical protein DLD82_16080 [Methanospirillum stamsii]